MVPPADGGQASHRYLASIPALGPAVAIRTRSCGGINRRDRDFAREEGIWQLVISQVEASIGGMRVAVGLGDGEVDATGWFSGRLESGFVSSRLVSNLESILSPDS